MGFSRRNFLVPLPRFESLDELNKYLREKCLGYRKTKIPGKPMSVGEMAKMALQSYIPLPAYRFDTSKTVEHKADSFYTHFHRTFRVKDYTNYTRLPMVSSCLFQPREYCTVIGEVHI